MIEFVSELEKVMPAEEIVFDPTPGFGPYKQYFPEEAVTHPAKANTLLIQYLIEKFTQEGDTICDPMAGSGSTGVIAALHGRNAILVDIEEKFVKWMLEAKRIVDRVQTLTEKGKITVLRGDARQLSRILNGVDSIVTSPPYADIERRDRSKESWWDEEREKKKAGGSVNIAKGYQASRNNTGNLPYSEISAVITSPPYEKSNCVKENSEEFWEKAKEMGKRGGSKPPSGTEERQYSDGNIGNLPHGSVDTIITSPPYADAKKGEADEEKMAERWDKAAEDKDWNTWSKTWKTEGRKRALKSLGSGYSKSEENIGNLPVGDIDAVITSPPYVGTNAFHDLDFMIKSSKEHCEKVRSGQIKGHYASEEARKRTFEKMKHGNFEDSDNISNLPVGDIDAVITSPPYSESVNAPNDPERRAERMRKAGLDPKTIVGGKARCGQVDWRYSDSKENIGNLSHGEISAIITSPPYLKSADAGAGVNKQREGDVKIGCATKGREVSDPEAVDNVKNYGSIDVIVTSPPYEESMSEKRHATPNTGRTEKLYEEKSLGSYPHSENQIGAMKKQTYLSEMLKVYSEMFKVLKKGGRAIVIVKPFIRDKKVIDLVYHTWLLMQKAGFKLEKVLKLRLKQESFWRILYYRRFPSVPKIKHEYVIVARK